MKKELRKGFCYQRANEKMMKDLEPFTNEIENLARQLANDLIKAMLRDGTITEEQAKEMYLDLKI